MGGVCIIGCLPDKFSARLKKVVLKFGWVNNMAIAPNSTEIDNKSGNIVTRMDHHRGNKVYT